MTHQHRSKQRAVFKAPPSPFVEVTFVFRDILQKPVEGLFVRLKAGVGAQSAPAWKYDADRGDPLAAPASWAESGSGITSEPVAASAPAANPVEPMVINKTDPITTDKDGYAMTICNAARNQPIDVLVKNRRDEYVWKATVTPKKDISALTISSPEYHLEANEADAEGRIRTDGGR
ncbi:hypothetical protein [Paraburkholderia bengalensis]|uniref:hypothetical protein n=1 Tax=Paraburkholderia bengalensis TaxID=2747562 RepID=UPI003014F100